MRWATFFKLYVNRANEVVCVWIFGKGFQFLVGTVCVPHSVSVCDGGEGCVQRSRTCGSLCVTVCVHSVPARGL